MGPDVGCFAMLLKHRLHAHAYLHFWMGTKAKVHVSAVDPKQVFESRIFFQFFLIVDAFVDVGLAALGQW